MPLTKSQLADLGLFGAAPAFHEPLHVGRPNIGDPQRLHDRINTMLANRWLSNDGPLVKEFERRVADHCGVKHCIAMCNGTVALEIAIRALDLSGEVILPSYTFVATAHALQWQEITPVFCDMDPTTHNIDPAKIESLITPSTTGIIGVHLWGRGCDVDAIEAIAAERKLATLYDAAHALGCTHRGRRIGGFGRAEVLSFHATKFVNSGEGGAVVTNDDALAEKMRLMRNFGFAHFDKVVHIGTNGKMCELSAAMGLTSLDSVDEFIAVNRRNYRHYREQLGQLRGISTIVYDERETPNYQYVVIEVDERETGLSRDELIEVFFAENIRARRYFWPGAHRMEPYRSYFPNAHLLLPETERVAAQIMVLPTGTAIGPSDIDAICAILRLALSNPQRVRAQLTERRGVMP